MDKKFALEVARLQFPVFAEQEQPVDDEILDDNGRPDECDRNADTELPCWPCYRDGFNTPAPSAVNQ